MLKSVYFIGLLLYIVLLIIFMVTAIFFRNAHYYETTIALSAFLLPILFAVGAFYSVTTYSRRKKIITFKEVFGRAFIPMFISCFLYLCTVVVYIDYVDRDAKNLLNYQYNQTNKNSLEEEYTKAKKIIKPNSPELEDLEKKYEESKVRINAKIAKKEDVFSLQYFSCIFAGYCFFFLLLSLFFGAFFRTKTAH